MKHHNLHGEAGIFSHRTMNVWLNWERKDEWTEITPRNTLELPFNNVKNFFGIFGL